MEIKLWKLKKTNKIDRNRALFPSPLACLIRPFHFNYLRRSTLTSECPFFTPFSLTDPSLVLASLAMKPILSSVIRELNCFKLIDLLEPYSLNKLSTKDFAAGPLMLRASSWEKTWQSVFGINAKMDRKATTQTAFLGIDAKIGNKAATLQTFVDSIEATFIRSMPRQSSLGEHSTEVFMPRVSHGRFTRHSARGCVLLQNNERINLKLFLKSHILRCTSHVHFLCKFRLSS